MKAEEGHHHSPNATPPPPNGKPLSFENVKEHILATARGKRVKPQVELSGWVLEQTVTPRGHPKGKTHGPWSQRVSVRPGSLVGVRAMTPKPVPACDSGVRRPL